MTDGKANSDAITERPTRIVGHYVCNGCQLDCGSKQDEVVLVIDEPLPNPSRLCFFLPCRRGITRSSLSADNCFGGLLEYLGGEGWQRVGARFSDNEVEIVICARCLRVSCFALTNRRRKLRGRFCDVTRCRAQGKLQIFLDPILSFSISKACISE